MTRPEANTIPARKELNAERQKESVTPVEENNFPWGHLICLKETGSTRFYFQKVNYISAKQQ